MGGLSVSRRFCFWKKKTFSIALRMIHVDRIVACIVKESKCGGSKFDVNVDICDDDTGARQVL